MLSSVIDIRDRVAKKLDGTITLKKRVVVLSLLFAMFTIVTLSVFAPFWVRRILRLNTNAVWLGDPESKRLAPQDAQLLKLKCQELPVTTNPPKVQPNAVQPNAGRARRRPRR
jgi:hypothetical protein